LFLPSATSDICRIFNRSYTCCQLASHSNMAFYRPLGLKTLESKSCRICEYDSAFPFFPWLVLDPIVFVSYHLRTFKASTQGLYEGFQPRYGRSAFVIALRNSCVDVFDITTVRSLPSGCYVLFSLQGTNRCRSFFGRFHDLVRPRREHSVNCCAVGPWRTQIPYACSPTANPCEDFFLSPAGSEPHHFTAPPSPGFHPRLLIVL